MKLWFRKVKKFPIFYQLDKMGCGSSCLKSIAKYYDKSLSDTEIDDIFHQDREGVSLLDIKNAAEIIGFETYCCKLNITALETQKRELPCILHWNKEHFVILYNIKNKKNKKNIYYIADPGHGRVKINEVQFTKYWLNIESNNGIALYLKPGSKFCKSTLNHSDRKEILSFLIGYIKPYKKYAIQIMLGMLLANLFALLLPLLLQFLVDYGINNKNYEILYLVFFSQTAIFIGGLLIGLIRSWLVLHVNTRISLTIISDFLLKLFQLPISFFDKKTVGDLSQRINDHHRIDSFLTGEFLNSLFSIITLIAFIVVLGILNFPILFIFVIMSVLSIFWVVLFQKKRMQLDYHKFNRERENQDKLIEMVRGIEEIKLFGGENRKRWEWEKLQVEYFKINIKSLRLQQFQQVGLFVFTQIKNILISFLAATLVIEGNLTLGALLSISTVVGQANTPIDQIVSFIRGLQDSSLSLKRLREIFLKQNEESDNVIQYIKNEKIVFKNVFFRYNGLNSPEVLKNISFEIPKGKITAIVGPSGSGKTTLMKLILKYYKPTSGNIYVGYENLNLISPSSWREKCGVVLQEGYIFFDTIAKNIVLNGDEIDYENLNKALYVSNLNEYIERLPLKLATKVGSSGIGISGGQKQRMLIARAIYKNPDYLFFDEATSSLDANNEKDVMNKLANYCKGRTVLIIAHRLSTVKNADQIIVMDKGEIVEVGLHEELIEQKTRYYELIKNQLEL